MYILPAIDLYDGKAVRLYKGDYRQMTVYNADPLVVAMKQWIDELYEDGRQTAMTDKELEEKIAELAPELHKE